MNEKQEEEKKKKEEEEFWETCKKEITDEFEETRRCLLNLYNSNIQTHAGYIIAIIIGVLALISNVETFLKNPILAVIFWILIAMCIGLPIYMIGRISFWTYYSSSAKFLTLDDAIELYKKNHLGKIDLKKGTPSVTNILNVSISQKLLDDKLQRRQIFLKLARWLDKKL